MFFGFFTGINASDSLYSKIKQRRFDFGVAGGLARVQV